MTKEQLQALISSGENEQLEFKETTGQRGDACQALCAFLNADGGTVVFGVSRKGILTGQLVSDSTKRDLFEVFAKFEPSVAVATEWVRVDETHVAIVCHVDAGARKPYLYDGRPYRRLQSSTAVMPQSDYEVFYPPFLLSTSDLYSRIRNVQVRILPEGMLLPREVPKYKDQSVLEALHNCIAHQDYARNGRIVVTEYVDRLEFENLGAFYDGAPNDYVNGGRTPTRYRNAQLVAAMREVNMIDESGYGIRRLYEWHISAKIAEMTGQEVEYVKAKRRTGGRLRSLIKDYLAQWKTADRQKINELLVDELGREMSTDDKMSKISNIIAVMRRNGEIENAGTDRKPIWKLTKTSGHEGRKSV